MIRALAVPAVAVLLATNAVLGIPSATDTEVAGGVPSAAPPFHGDGPLPLDPALAVSAAADMARYLAIPILRPGPSGSGTAAYWVVDGAVLGLDADALLANGVPVVAPSDVGALDIQGLTQIAVPDAVARASVLAQAAGAPSPQNHPEPPITDSTPVPVTIYVDEAEQQQGGWYSDVLSSFEAARQVLASEPGVTINQFRLMVTGAPVQDVSTFCHIEQVSAYESQFKPHSGAFVAVFSPGEMEGAWGYASAETLTSQVLWGGSWSSCRGAVRSPAFIPWTYVMHRPLGFLGYMENLAIHEFAHTFSMRHLDAACWTTDHFHKTMEAFTSASDAPAACGSNALGHYHRDYSVDTDGRIKSERVHWTLYYNTRPTVVVSAPAPGTTVSGSVTVAGSAVFASCCSGLIEVRIDGGPWQAASGTTSWQYPWNTAGAVNGPHQIEVRARDNTFSDVASLPVRTSNPGGDPSPPAGTRVLENGGAGPLYDGSAYRGKHFRTGVPSGTITGVCIFGRTADTSTGVAIKPSPSSGAAPLETNVYVAVAGQWNCRSVSWGWSSGNLFVYNTKGNAEVGAETASCDQSDSWYSLDSGASWGQDCGKRGFRVVISGASDAPPQIASLSCAPSPSTPGETVTCRFQANDDSGSVRFTISWFDGDMNHCVPDCSQFVGNGVEQTATYAYPGPGSFTIRLRAYDPSGQPAEQSRIQSVGRAPTITSFACSPSPSTPDQTVTCSFQAIDDSGSVRFTIAWFDGDDNHCVTGCSQFVASGVQQSGTYAYPATGTYTIRLRAYDPDGAFSEQTRTQTVAAAPTPPSITAFSCAPNPSNPGQTVTCNFQAMDDSGNVRFTIAWFDGDMNHCVPGCSTFVGNNVQQSGTNAYPAAGTYTIRLRAYDPDGNLDEETRTHTVGSPPSITAFNCTPSPSAPGQTVTCRFQATDDSGSVRFTIAWFDGDMNHCVPDCSTFVGNDVEQQGTYAYPSGGTYAIRLRAYDPGGNFSEQTRAQSVG